MGFDLPNILVPLIRNLSFVSCDSLFKRLFWRFRTFERIVLRPPVPWRTLVGEESRIVKGAFVFVFEFEGCGVGVLDHDRLWRKAFDVREVVALFR